MLLSFAIETFLALVGVCMYLYTRVTIQYVIIDIKFIDLPIIMLSNIINTIISSIFSGI